MQYRAVIKKSNKWWIGWLVDLPGVNAQKKTKEELFESLRVGAEDILSTYLDPTPDEELVKIEI